MPRVFTSTYRSIWYMLWPTLTAAPKCTTASDDDDERFEHGAVADVAVHVAHAGVRVRRPRAGPMHLRLQAVEDGHRIPERTETIDEMRPDVAGAAGDENRLNGHQKDTTT